MIGAILTTIHVIICFGLILVVLLQSGKGTGLAGSLGGPMSGAHVAFGGRGTADILSKATTVLAVLFMLFSLGLTIFSMGLKTEASNSSNLKKMFQEDERTVQPFNQATDQGEQIQSPQTSTQTPTSVPTPPPADTTK